MTRKTTPSISPKGHSKKVRIVYQSPPNSTTIALPARIPAKVPVFMLPQNEDLRTIPEEAEIHQGFNLNMTLQPHQTRVFSGLVSMEDPKKIKTAIERSATTAVEYRSFHCLKTIGKALEILARAHHVKHGDDGRQRQNPVRTPSARDRRRLVLANLPKVPSI
jgi:hypothetical protein